MQNNISFSECVDLLENLAVECVGIERVFIDKCVGRVLCEPILARENNPKFHTSNMDGYAFRFADLGILSESGLKIASVNKAGNADSCAIQKGECIKTFTGAKMPQGADCLVIVENICVKGDRIFLANNLNENTKNTHPLAPSAREGGQTIDSANHTKNAESTPKQWQHIRKMGENYKQGDILLPQGEILSPFSVGILAQNHNILISVYRRIRVGILSGGDELIELGELPQSQNYIYSSNNHALCAIARALNAECKIYPLLQDNPQSIRESLSRGLRDNDIIITTGGMSKGDFDFTKDIIREFGECIFSGVKIKPGKVVAHIKCDGAFSGKHIFALPGNPSSSIVSFLLFGRIIMQKMLNLPPQIPIKKGKLLRAVDNVKNDRLCFELADLSVESGFYAVNPRQNRNSYMINDFSGAFCILAQKSYQKGEFVDIILLNDLLRL
ncbi:molybdopterin molybdotransferase MoeA [Helicobacter sp. 23-1045]